jgi:hypothetical protein
VPCAEAAALGSSGAPEPPLLALDAGEDGAASPEGVGGD